MGSLDIKLMSEMGYALWEDPSQAQAMVRDTVSAITITESDPLRASEKAVRALLFQAEKYGTWVKPQQPSEGLQHEALQRFQYLFAEERIILLALHSGKWSYERIARAIEDTVDSVQTLAWNARVHLSSGQAYPAGSKPITHSCPEYDSRKPWTQKFLDGNYRGQEKLFLQDHLNSCTSCREALVRAKHVFYGVDALIHKISEDFDQQAGNTGLHDQLQQWVEEGVDFRTPQPLTSAQLLMRFLGRWEVLLVFAAWATFFIFRHHSR